VTGTTSGDLLRLHTWWHDHRPARARSIGWVTDPTDRQQARERVDRFIDAGATVIALHSHGSELTARAVIAQRAKVTAVEVRDQPPELDDASWMSEVAAIRDLRASEEIADPAISAAAEVFVSAQRRGTPVVFDGLIAHAGATTIDAFDDSWLPASSSDDPAITVAQGHWKVEPALDLRLRGEGDLGLRAVFALLDVVADD
jgi:hypothetical protein